jgi:hypothetical protein
MLSKDKKIDMEDLDIQSLGFWNLSGVVSS